MEMFDSLFEILRSKILVTVMYPALIALLTITGGLWWSNRGLKADIKKCEKESGKLETKAEVYEAHVRDAAAQIRLLQEQCEELKRYEDTKPKKPVDSDDELSDELLDSIMHRSSNPAKPDISGNSSRKTRAPATPGNR
jgi:hypothetical protein